MHSFSTKFIVKNGTLYLRILYCRKKIELSLTRNVSQYDLDNALSQSPERKNLGLAKTLDEYRMKLTAVKLRLSEHPDRQLDIATLRDTVRSSVLGAGGNDEQPAGSFVAHFNDFVRHKHTEGTRGVYRHTLSKIRTFDPGIDEKDFSDIDLKWLMRFEDFCALTACKNARNIHLRNIRAVFNSALDEEITTFYPFRRFKIRPEATRKRALTPEQLRTLLSCEVEPYCEVYRDMFKLIFLLIGINAVDLYNLKGITADGRIEYRRAKTHRLYSIKAEPEAIELIRKYRGCKKLLSLSDRWESHKTFIAQMNKAIQSIGAKRSGLGGKKDREDAPFGMVTSYWARHTWATVAASLEIPKETIAAALGHGGNTVTDIYIDFDQRKVDLANRRVIDLVLYGGQDRAYRDLKV